MPGDASERPDLTPGVSANAENRSGWRGSMRCIQAVSDPHGIMNPGKAS
ncbi:hypothetical protein G3N56_13645 [Desulfovibrio sulfodismutans]|uniref:Uncharacterized protein n=1 Tax=Desulfolutivibrio sulfodismutans TaxID=63561 RepID=A0A7K3NPP6_9BACT|nr:hypothetical protein [Desulfolutivibrio sulfodismutans]NDY57775.1 hypothetical protein [Desulfolutivibrio sulfodismutans]